MHKFEEPKTIQECNDRIKELRGEIDTIRAQLGSKNKRGPNGERLSTKSFYQWRDKALGAKAAKAAEIRFLKSWLAEQDGELSKEQTEDPMGLLCDAWRSLNDVYDEIGWDDVTDKEKDLYNAIGDYLKSKGYKV